MEIKTAKQCNENGLLTHDQLVCGHIYRLVSEDGACYIACSPSCGSSSRATGAVSLKTGYRLDWAFLGTQWVEVKGHVCIEE